MNVLVLFAHPVETSFGAALHRQVVSTLRQAGHVVDDCDLNAEGFSPVMSAQERLDYHTYPKNIEKVADYVERLRRADALVIVTPIWNFGFPAVLKGYFDKVWAPGVTFKLVDGDIVFTMDRLKKIAMVTTYGATRLRAFLAGNPPRAFVRRVLRAHIGWRSPCPYLALYALDRSTPQSRAAFLNKVSETMARF